MILDSVTNAKERWPELEPLLQRVPPRESYRQWLRVIHWRLSQTATLEITDRVSNIPGAYMSAAELHSDVTLIRNSLRTTGNTIIAENESTAPAGPNSNFWIPYDAFGYSSGLRRLCRSHE